MRIFLTASKDTTLYQTYPTNNAGLDEVLELGKLADISTVEPSYATASARIAIDFELPLASEVPNDAQYFLNFKLANADNVRRNQRIDILLISRSWEEGSGYFYQNVRNVNDGATWQQATSTVSWSLAGGDVTAVSSSTTLSQFPLQDLRIDVTTLIQPIVNSSSVFYGILAQFPAEDEFDDANEGNIKVFSTQTHTIHLPTLEVVWDSQTFITGSSLLPIPSLDVKVTPTNVQEKYYKGENSRIDFSVRDPYPAKSFDATLRYRSKYYLPTSSYYSIVDANTNIPIVPFDEFSTLDCDASGTYMRLDTEPLFSGRFYTIKLRIDSGSYTKMIDTHTLFRII